MKKHVYGFIFAVSLAWFSVAAFAHEGHKAEHNHPYPTKPFSVNNGKSVYGAHCIVCHGVNGDGNGVAAGTLNPKPTNFLDLKYMPMRSRVDHYEAIAEGRSGTSMPSWKAVLTENQIWDVIAYIEHLFNHQWDEDGHASDADKSAGHEHHKDHGEHHGEHGKNGGKDHNDNPDKAGGKSSEKKEVSK